MSLGDTTERYRPDDLRSGSYVLSENDLALARPGDELAARIGLTPRMVPGGHQSMLTSPDEVTKALLTY
jgi:hypothetical protein